MVWSEFQSAQKRVTVVNLSTWACREARKCWLRRHFRRRGSTRRLKTLPGAPSGAPGAPSGAALGRFWLACGAPVDWIRTATDEGSIDREVLIYGLTGRQSGGLGRLGFREFLWGATRLDHCTGSCFSSFFDLVEPSTRPLELTKSTCWPSTRPLELTKSTCWPETRPPELTRSTLVACQDAFLG